MHILDTIAAATQERIDRQKLEQPLSLLKSMVSATKSPAFAFSQALKDNSDLSFILECKKASPSKGLIDPVFDYKQIALDYKKAGADCISVLTEPKWFLGKDEYVKDISLLTNLPCLQKDFFIDEYMIYKARVLGASCILLICSLLDYAKLKDFIALAHELALDALVETHNHNEIDMALKAKADIIGVNNRNLKDFSVNTDNCLSLRSYVPDDVLFVAESGIKSADDIKKLQEHKVDAVLIGQHMMTATDKTQALAMLKGV